MLLVRRKCGSAARARATNSLTAPARSRSSHVLCPFRRHLERRHPIHELSRRAQRLAAGGQHARERARHAAALRPCARPPRSHARNCRGPAESACAPSADATRSGDGAPAASVTPSAVATVTGTSSGSDSGPSSATHTPSANLGQQLARDLEAQPRLADAPGADQRDQPMRDHQIGHLAELGVSADQFGNRGSAGSSPASAPVGDAEARPARISPVNW